MNNSGEVGRLGITRAHLGGQMADQDEQQEQGATDQGDGATSETVTNEQAQQLVDSGEAQPGPAEDAPADETA